jgi:two-component system, NarL family, invasion response regulator UvrY
VRSVLLVDDHPVVRQGIARILAAEIPDLSLTEAVDGQSAVDYLRGAAPDLVLLDLSLPGDTGLSLLRRIKREFPAVPVMIVSMHPADQFARRSLQAGAVGYVAKDSDPQELVQAVRSALAGAPHVPAEVHAAVQLEREPPRHSRLSDREYQVLRMIGAGRTVSEIATELGLSVKTVSTYRARVLEKMELRTSAELIHYAVVNKLVP